MNKRYYPAPDLDRAVYHLQNHPELAGKDPKDLQYVTLFDNRTVGRNAWERAKKVYASKQETRNLITVDFNTRMIAYIGEDSRLVTLSRDKRMLRARLEMIAERGYTEVFHSKDKRFYVYTAPAIARKEAA